MPYKTLPSSRGSLRRSGRNLLKLLSGKIINVPLGLLQVSLTVQLVGAKGYGFIILLNVFGHIISDIAAFQSWQTILHYGLKPFENKNIPLFQRVLRFSLLLDFSSGLMAMLISIPCAYFFSNLLGWPPEWHALGIMYSFAVIFMTSATSNGVLRLLNRFDWLAVQGIVTTLTRFLGVVFLTLIGGGIKGAVIVWMVAAFADFFSIFLMASILLYRQGFLSGFFGRIHDGLTRDLPGIWRFAWNTNLNVTLSLAFGEIPTQIIGSMLGPVSAGYYNIANKIAEAAAKPMTLFQSTLYPEMARSWQSNKPTHLYKMGLQITLLTGGVATIILVILPYVAVPLLKLMLHKPPTPETLTLLYWLASAELIQIWGLTLEPILITTGNTKGALISRIVDTLIFFPLLVLLISYWKLSGIGPATLIATLLLILCQLGFLLKGRKKKAVFTTQEITPQHPSNDHSLDPIKPDLH